MLSFHRVHEAIASRMQGFCCITGEINLADFLSEHGVMLKFGLSLKYYYSGKMTLATYKIKNELHQTNGEC
jgi:hypothetical protein